METPGASDVNAYPTCKICDRGTLRPRKIFRLNGPAVAIGYILLIPSILGMAGCAIMLVGIAIAGPALIRGSGALAVILSGGSIIAVTLIGIGCFVGGLLGWLLVMKKHVLQCDNCGAVVNASTAINSHPNRSIGRASVFGSFFLLLILVGVAVVLSHRVNSTAQPTIVPFVGCKSDGQVGPQDAPTGEPKSITISPELAQMVAYYKASDGSGVLAPRGWYCFGTYGSSGSNLYVTPMPLNSIDLFSDSWKGIPSYGIQLSESDGGTSGRFAVAEIIARVFPAHWSFVRQVIAEGIEPASSFLYGPYPTDKLIYRDKETVEYVTPPNTEGLGTQSYLAKDGDPIDGVAILTGEDPDLTQLAARLPPDMSDLLAVVIRQVEQDSSQPAAEPGKSKQDNSTAEPAQ